MLRSRLGSSTLSTQQLWVKSEFYGMPFDQCKSGMHRNPQEIGTELVRVAHGPPTNLLRVTAETRRLLGVTFASQVLQLETINVQSIPVVMGRVRDRHLSRQLDQIAWPVSSI